MALIVQGYFVMCIEIFLDMNSLEIFRVEAKHSLAYFVLIMEYIEVDVYTRREWITEWDNTVYFHPSMLLV